MSEQFQDNKIYETITVEEWKGMITNRHYCYVNMRPVEHIAHLNDSSCITLKNVFRRWLFIATVLGNEKKQQRVFTGNLVRVFLQAQNYEIRSIRYF